MRGRFRRLVTVSVARVGSSQPLLFLVSSVLGALLAVLLRTYEASLADLPRESYHQAYDWSYERWLDKQGLARVASDPDLARYSNRSTRYSEDQLDPDSEAAFLFRNIKVFCLVFPTNAGVTEILYFGGGPKHLSDGVPYSSNWWRFFFSSVNLL